MKLFCYIAIIVFGLFSFDGMCQKEEGTTLSKHSVGLNIGLTSGVGFSYKFMSSKFGFEVTSLPIYTQEQKLILLQGFSLNFVLKKKERVDEFIYVANGLMFTRKHIQNSYVSGPNQEMTHEDYIARGFLYRAGGGWGVRIRGDNKVDVVLKMGALWYSNWYNDQGILPSAGIALHYRL